MLEGKVAIVTGASRGLGRAIVEALVAEGVRVVAASRDAAVLEELEVSSGGAVVAVPTDVSDREAVAALPGRAVDALGRLDALVSNAGVFPAGRFEDMPLGAWDQAVAVNLMAPVILAKAAAPILLSQGSGKVLTVASTSGLVGKPVLAAYSATKAAVIRFTEALAGEWADRGVQVNAIAPGAFDTDAQAAVTGDKEVLRRRLRKIPAGRMGRAEEIGPLACYLASPLSNFVTGATFTIDGGEVHKL
ncbi:SDR family NAD(P)-dependent oxidoreductase [Euzebya tangerina]|uniref:SDR family NAD(P)-dependent oxidoreductase n=1 Tax=Euzebya tangerina TaxID=591198 RepID=UPI001F0BFF13|nr:SDR family NAD(P)-dependent oxidoreductase [Euzebya tangerina]